MATLEQTHERVRAILTSHRIDDGGALRARGYRTSAEEIFLAAAAQVLRPMPRVRWSESGIADQARSFCRDMPERYGVEDHCAYALPRGYFLVQNSWASGLIVARSANSWSKDVTRPSVTRDGVVRGFDITPDELDVVRRRAEMLRDMVEAHLRRTIPSLLAAGDPVRLSRQTVHAYHIEVEYAWGLRRMQSVWNGALLHDAPDRLMRIFVEQARDIRIGWQDFQDLQDHVAARKDELEAASIASGLPITYRLAPCPPINGSPYVSIVIDGYGPTGLPSTEPIMSQPFAADLSAVLNLRTHQIRAQAARHRDYGPLPGSNPGVPWTVDAPTARRLALTGRGSEIAAMIAAGRGADEGDAAMTIRVKGRTLLGTFELAPGISWKGDRVEAERVQLSDTVAAAVPGRSVRSVVEHDLLSDAEIATRVTHRRTKAFGILVVNVRPQMVPIAEIDTFDNK